MVHLAGPGRYDDNDEGAVTDDALTSTWKKVDDEIIWRRKPDQKQEEDDWKYTTVCWTAVVYCVVGRTIRTGGRRLVTGVGTIPTRGRMRKRSGGGKMEALLTAVGIGGDVVTRAMDGGPIENRATPHVGNGMMEGDNQQVGGGGRNGLRTPPKRINGGSKMSAPLLMANKLLFLWRRRCGRARTAIGGLNVRPLASGNVNPEVSMTCRSLQ